MKKLFSLCVALLFAVAFAFPALAADESRCYQFSLTANGSDSITAVPGEIITVVLTLDSVSGSAGPMYALQDEIEYDPTFFRLVDNSCMLGANIESTELGMRNGMRRLYMNYLSFDAATSWPETFMVGYFQLEVIATSGVSSVTNENFAVSTQNGQDAFQSESKNLTVTVSTLCTIAFESNGGSAIASQTVPYGETLAKPQPPVREGKHFAGWYKNIDLTEAWQFDTDTVSGNMTLYAKWTNATATTPETGGNASQGTSSPQTGDILRWSGGLAVAAALMLLLLLFACKKTVLFESNGGTPIKKVRVFKGKKLTAPEPPQKQNAVFAGWHQDEACTIVWDFAQDCTEHDMALYAKWNSAQAE